MVTADLRQQEPKTAIDEDVVKVSFIISIIPKRLFTNFNLFLLESTSSRNALEIPLTEQDHQILMAIGKIKRQKQRPSVDRLYNMLSRTNNTFSRHTIQSVL